MTTSTVRHFLFDDLGIRGMLVQASDTWQAMQERRNYPPVVRDLLGEMAAVTALMGSSLKTPGRLTFQLQGNGPIAMMVVDCEEHQGQLRLRGMAKATGEILPAPAPQLFGNGHLMLTLQTRNPNAAPYQSFVPIAGESIAAIFEHYLEQSEQLPSRLWLETGAHQACGLFLQRLPHSPKTTDADGWNRVQLLAATLRPGELALPAETLLTHLFPDETIRLFEPKPVIYHCPRNENKVRQMLRSLGRQEIESILAEHGEIFIRDDIGNHEYRFGAGIVEELFGATEIPPHILH